MRRALDLAQRGTGLASPNPAVGAVLVRGGRMVGQGFHSYDGRKHAEILALEAAGKRASGATLYINLEPCSHTGRTGPCADALIAARVRRWWRQCATQIQLSRGADSASCAPLVSKLTSVSSKARRAA